MIATYSYNSCSRISLFSRESLLPPRESSTRVQRVAGQKGGERGRRNAAWGAEGNKKTTVRGIGRRMSLKDLKVEANIPEPFSQAVYFSRGSGRTLASSTLKQRGGFPFCPSRPGCRLSVHPEAEKGVVIKRLASFTCFGGGASKRNETAKIPVRRTPPCLRPL